MRPHLVVIVCVLLASMMSGVGRADSPAELDKLLQTLESASAQDRPQALEAIGELGSDGRAAIATLVKAMDDERPDTRAAAATAIGKIGLYDEAAAARLLKAFEDTGELRGGGGAVRHFAADALGKLGAKSMPQLIPRLSSDDVRIRRCAALAIGRIGSPAEAAVPALHEMLRANEDPTRVLAIYALRAIGRASAPAMPTLTEMLQHKDFHTQYWSCRAIGAIGEPDALPAVPTLIELLGTSNPSVKRNAAYALGQIGPAAGERVITPLVGLLKDKLQPVRRNAVIALGELGPFAKRSTDAVRAAMNDEQFRAPAEAAAALWQITGESDPSLDVLLGVLQGKQSPWEAALAFERLGKTGKPAVTKLTELVTSDNSETQYFAIASLAGIGPQAAAALPALTELLKDPDKDLRNLVAETIAKIQPSP
jgi:HEAT repeat protein